MCDDVPTLILTTSAHIELILPFTPRQALRSSMAATPTLSRTPEAGTISIRHFSLSSLPLFMRSPQAGRESHGSC